MGLFAAWLAAAACAPAGQALRDSVEAEAKSAGPRVTIARHLALAAAEPADAAGARLAALWPLSATLADDRMVRAAIAALPTKAVPVDLAAVRAVEDARAALVGGRDHDALRLARGAAKAGGRTGARAQLLVALALAGRDPDTAQRHLHAVTRAKLAGRLGASLKAFGYLTLASIHYDADRVGEALRGYLKVPSTSGHWVAARLGLAWCQYRSKRPARTVAILRQMPGGLAADPEHALLAAMAVHWLGDATTARQVVDAGLSAAGDYRAATVEVEAVLASVAGRFMDGPATPVTGSSASVARRPTVMLAALELLEARREQAEHPVLASYTTALAAQLATLVAQEAAAEELRVGGAVEQLKVLRPQLVD